MNARDVALVARIPSALLFSEDAAVHSIFSRSAPAQHPEILQALFTSLDQRPRPEDVADLALRLLAADLSRGERAILEVAARGALRPELDQFSSMVADFARPVAPQRSIAKARELFRAAPPLADADYLDVERVRAFVDALGGEIRRPRGARFKAGRMSREQRRDAGLDHSRRRYNKLFRFLLRFEAKLDKLVLEQRKYRATRVAKAGLASEISFNDFSSCDDAAAFCAYASARKNRRSVFTNKAQDRFFDDVCQMLLERLERRPAAETVNAWRAIARVMPDVKIVKHLHERDRLELFGEWTSLLADLADLLRSTWQRSGFNRRTMIVKRGDDSSTWNALAGAWNEARRAWMSVAFALGLDDAVEHACFGKVMRLMAADVAAWHRSSGGQLEPDTLVWADLPAPWEVFTGARDCPRSLVESVCAKHGVDPVKKSWIAPSTDARVAVPFVPTPELVHGVAVAHPALAVVLKKAGAFSGKPRRTRLKLPDVVVERDEHGFAVGARSAEDDE